MKIEDSFYIGYISKTRGLKGELQLFFEFEDYQDLDLDVIFVEINKKLVPYFVDQINMQKNSTAFVTLEDVDHIDKAQDLVRKKIYLPQEKFPERDPEDFRYTDLIGYLVIDHNHGELGPITHVQEMPQQFIATVDMDGTELLFPLSDELMTAIHTDEAVLEVQLPEGLVELYRDL